MPCADATLLDLGYALPTLTEPVERARIRTKSTVGIRPERGITGAGRWPIAVSPANVADQNAGSILAEAGSTGMLAHARLVAAEAADAVRRDTLRANLASGAIGALARPGTAPRRATVVAHHRTGAALVTVRGQGLHAVVARCHPARCPWLVGKAGASGTDAGHAAGGGSLIDATSRLTRVFAGHRRW